MLKILTHKLESTAESCIGMDQFGFGKGRDIRDTMWHCAYCMKETRNTAIKSMSATLTMKKLLIV